VNKPTFIVDIEVEVTTNDPDPKRDARVLARFKEILPAGSRTVADVGSGIAHLRAWLPATRSGAIGALYAVACALELALLPERSPVDALGWRPVDCLNHTEHGVPVTMRLSVHGDRP